MNRCEMQQIPKVGQILWYIDLSQIRSRSVSQTLELLESLGHQPQLRYQETKQGLKLFALLKDEQTDSGVVIEDEYLVDQRLVLYEALPGEDMAIHFACGLPVPLPASISVSA
jgi:hypothetical protein